jgi:pimeloyl-ACP methyl ester carboxylesterase
LWKGPLAVPGGALELSFSVVALTGGSYFAALDVPMQKLSRVPADMQQILGTDSVRVLVPGLGSRLLGRLSADGQQLSGTWYQPGLKAPLVLRRSAMLHTVDVEVHLSKPYREENVIFPNFTAHIELAGTLTVPAGVGPFPAVVLVSDMGPQDRDGLAVLGAEGVPASKPYRLLGTLADYLTRRGIAVLRFDDRGVGGSKGMTAATTTTQRISDVQAGLNYLRTQPDVDLQRLGVIGHGEGANVALLTATKPLPPAFVVGLAGYGQSGFEIVQAQQAAALRARKLAPAQYEYRLRRQRAMADMIRYSTNVNQTENMVASLLSQTEPELEPAAAQARAAELLAPWHRAFLAFNPLENLEAVQVPVLLLGGLADEQAPPLLHQGALEKELRASGNHAVTSQRMPGVNHLLQPPITQWAMLDGEPHPIVSPALLETLRGWLAGQTKK